jgi:antitoxin component HigA of HigAB toxin-antitoxin module
VQIEIIKTEKQYQSMLDRVDSKFDKKVNPNSEEGNEIKLVIEFIIKYEDLYYQIPPK